MKRLAFTALTVSVMTVANVFSQKIAFESPIFSKDKEIESLEYHPIDLKSMVDQTIHMPKVAAPLGFTPNMINEMEVPNPIAKIGLIEPPSCNNQGSVTLSYDFEFTPAKNGVSPDFKLSYDNKRGYGLLGLGWDIDFPKIVIDTTDVDWKKNYGSCFYNGLRYRHKDGITEEEYALKLDQDQDVTFYAETNPFDSYLIRHSRVTKKRDKDGKLVKDDKGNPIIQGVYIYWELVNKNGTKTIFGNIKNPYHFEKESTSDKDKKEFQNNSRLYRLKDNSKDGSNVCDTIVAEWHASYTHDFYGNYVDYMYKQGSEKKIPLLDSIAVGNANEYPHTVIKFSFEHQYSGSDSIVKYNRYGMEYALDNLLSKIDFKYSKDKESNSDYESIRSYEFRFERLIKDDKFENHAKSLARLIQNTGKGKVAEHSFNYYDDKEMILKRKEYYRNTQDENVLPFLLDRSMMLQNIHNPLGGCITVDYSSSDYKLPLEQLPTIAEEEDTEEEETEETEEDLIEYAPIEKIQYPVDSLGHILVMSDLRVSNGISNFIHNRFEYKQQVWNEDTTSFFGFDTVLNHTLDLKDQTVYDTWEKTYKCEDAMLENRLSTAKLYSKDGKLVKSYELTYSTVYNSSVLGSKNFYKVNLSENVIAYRNNSMDPVRVRYNYTNGKNGCYLKGLNIDNSNSGIAPEYEFTYNDAYSEKGFWGLLQSIGARYSGQDYYSVTFEYSDPQNPDRVTSKTQKVSDSKSIVTSYAYDSDGNMIRVTYPVDANGDKMVVNYLYDRRYNMHLNVIEDALGYRTELGDYNYHFATPQTIVDRNGVRMEQEFDELGQILKVIAPYEIENDEGFTIKYDYARASLVNLDNDSVTVEFRDTLLTDATDSILDNVYDEKSLLKILSYIYDLSEDRIKEVEKSGVYNLFDICSTPWNEEDKKTDIIVLLDSADASKCLCHDTTMNLAYTVRTTNRKGEFLVFSDGLGRIAQTKLKRNVTHISGGEEGILAKEDVKIEYLISHADVEPLYQDGRVFRAFSGDEKKVYKRNNDLICEKSFDELNRLIMVSENGNPVVSVSYINGRTSDYTSSRYGNLSENKDYNGRVLSKKYSYSYNETAGDSIVQYEYDIMGQLVRSKINGVSTSYSYDLRGLVIKSNNAVDGELTYSYDDAGNLLSVKKNGEEVVKYTYKLNQLTAIEYPKASYNNVKFAYGDKNAKYNRVGQIEYIEDAVGAEELFYGNMGDVIKTRRSIVAPNAPIRTYEMKWQYNSFNQITGMTYPDQEKVSYQYDLSGLPISVTGSKSYSYGYVTEAGYDLFGRQNYVSYCNGEKTHRLYDEMGFLSQQQVEKGGEITMSTSYEKQLGENYLYRRLEGSLMDNHFQQNLVSLYSGNTLYGFANYKNTEDGNASYEYYANSVNRNSSEVSVGLVQKDMDLEGLHKLSITYAYDENGNRLMEGVEEIKGDDGLVAAKNDGGYVSTYWYDYKGYPVITTSGGSESLFVNGNEVTSFVDQPSMSISMNRYFDMDSLSYTKHVYFGDEEVVRKTGYMENYGQNPAREERAGTYSSSGKDPDYKTMYADARNSLIARYSMMDMDLEVDEVPYSDGKGEAIKKSGSLKNSNINKDKEAYEEKQYYFHRVNGDSIFYLSDLSAKVADVIFVTPFGRRLFGK